MIWGYETVGGAKIIGNCVVTTRSGIAITEGQLQDDDELYYQVDEVNWKNFERYYSSKVTTKQERQYKTSAEGPVLRTVARGLLNITKNTEKSYRMVTNTRLDAKRGYQK